MIKGILFDFNGVIIDDEPIQMKAYQEILKKEGIELTEEEYRSCFGMDDVTFVEAAYTRAGKTPETNKVLAITNAKTARWRELVADELPIFEGVDNFIHKMAKDFTLGIVSMAKREEIEFVLDTAGLRGCFPVIVSAEDVSICKPHPECYRVGFSKLDLYRSTHGHLPMNHKDCLVIEDTPQGIMAAKGADLMALGVTNTVDADEMRDAGADSIAKNLNDWMPDSVRRVFV